MHKQGHNPSLINQMFQQAIGLHQKGMLIEAQRIYEQILKLQPKNFNVLDLLATISAQNKRFEEAVDLWSKAIKCNSNDAATFSNRGLALHELKKFEAAIASYDQAIKIKPDFVQAYYNRGNTLKEIKQFENAIASYDHAIKIKPDFVQAYYNRGNTLKEIKQFEQAIINYNKAISLKPDNAEAYNNLGLALQKLKQYDQAIINHNKAISLKPDNAEAYNNLGLALQKLKQYDLAIVNYNKAISLKPDNADAYNNLGFLFDELKKVDQAMICYQKALNIKPDFAEAYNNLGGLLSELKRYDEALIQFNQSININPEIDFLLDNLIHTKMQLCDWDRIDDLTNQIIENTFKYNKISNPFVLLALTDNLNLHKQSARIYAETRYPENKNLPSLTQYPKHHKIRIGYFSADFREHPVSYLTAELFEIHNRDQFEIIAFSFGINTQDPLRRRLEKGFDQFIDVKEKTDLEIAILARKMEIDIAVDLGGFTSDCRTEIFALRAAPIQLSYIGYLGSMGTNYFDYLIADQTLIPQNYQHFYAEKILYLPSYQANDSKREISNKHFTRSELELPSNGFVFCCFNSVYKITPRTFNSWMQILKAVKDSVLFLLDENQTATSNLKKQAKLSGVEESRLIFAKPLPLPEYLARYRIANLFLDTLPYNAGTTASDALRMGLPVLTLMGKSFASRMASSLLNAVGLPELITTNQNAYESLAIELATQPNKLEAIRTKLVNNLPNSPLFNAKLFTQHLESAYQSIYQRYQDNLSPDHINIKV